MHELHHGSSMPSLSLQRKYRKCLISVAIGLKRVRYLVRMSEESVEARRPRLTDHDVITSCLAATVTRPNFVAYTDKLDSAADPTILVASKELLRRFQGAGCLSVTQKAMQHALITIDAKHRQDGTASWKLKEEDVSKWADQMAKRVRAMLRHFSQALGKGNNATWVRLITGGETPPASSCTAATSSCAPKYFYGWEHSQGDKGCAWRALVEKPDAREPAIGVEIPENAEATSPIIALFGDGSKHPMATMSVEKYQNDVLAPVRAHMQNAKPHKGTRPCGAASPMGATNR